MTLRVQCGIWKALLNDQLVAVGLCPGQHACCIHAELFYFRFFENFNLDGAIRILFQESKMGTSALYLENQFSLQLTKYVALMTYLLCKINFAHETTKRSVSHLGLLRPSKAIPQPWQYPIPSGDESLQFSRK